MMDRPPLSFSRQRDIPPRARELAKHFGLALRTIEGRSAEIRAKSGVAVRDLVLEVLWVALGDTRT